MLSAKLYGVFSMLQNALLVVSMLLGLPKDMYQNASRTLSHPHRAFFGSAATDLDWGSFTKSSNALSIFSLVSRVKSSTSAAVRPLVGIGCSTASIG